MSVPLEKRIEHLEDAVEDLEIAMNRILERLREIEDRDAVTPAAAKS